MTADTHEAVAHHDTPEVIGRRQRMGVILLIVADVAFVLSLVFTYLYLRALNTEGAWISPDHPKTAGVLLGWVIAATMIASWGAYRWGELASYSGQRERLLLGVMVALVLVAAGIGLQIYQMVTLHLVAADGAYVSAFMALSGYHVFHLGLTLFIGVGLWNRARLGLTATNNWHVRLVGYWWTWVAISAVITAATTSLTTSPNVVH